MGLSRLMYRHFGSTGIPMAQVENASASGSTAVRQACIDVAPDSPTSPSQWASTSR
jgi:acetyl-CoA acetyltransferase